ncbi:helix-turn-helix domain-containing protein [Desulfosporosinus hippei]|uniref:DNA-binding transcriptional regulator, XRE-family HTH domain n=1 Tax=Desulfosporosinus hippei DSM 8344 TaxID=1121419 RepID=A0A1G7VQC3_9FIRM|nr:helix-turn-helix transcriptional regulator [Desulfosporosinus hippei]SDG61110.1 DNA-binding transcriptional regulator, XRE-family HTH domain [Desulfosporosinus hippei DSM 8344]
MYEKYLSERIAKLRTMKKVSARDMSLSIGQNENYINHIENGKSMPSMQVFFYICEYFNISPKEFFDEKTINPPLIKAVIDDLNQLDEKQIMNIHELIKGLRK